MPGDSGCNRGDYARVVFYFLPREAMGAATDFIALVIDYIDQRYGAGAKPTAAE
jgi:hypothetical protein